MPDNDTIEDGSIEDIPEPTEGVPGEDDTAVEAESSDDETEPETFPREVVEKLRQENGKYRRRAAKADTYAQRLHTELVRATGKLADPTDLPFNEDHLDDPDAMTAAIDDLVTRKPHLASRKPMGEIGQGATPSAATVDLAAILRPRAQ